MLFARDIGLSESLQANGLLHVGVELARLGFGAAGGVLHSMGVSVADDLWGALTAPQRAQTCLRIVEGRPQVGAHPSWLCCGSRAPLDFLVAAASSGEWAGHSLGVVRDTPACPLCGARGAVGGYTWAADPWSHLLTECDAALAHVESGS